MAHGRIGSLTFSSVLVLLALGACVAAPAGNDGQQAEQAPVEAKPEVLCQHVREIAGQDGTSGEALDTVQRECVQTLTSLRDRYQTFTACVERARTAAALRGCESELAKPPSLLGAGSPEARVAAICDHVIGLLTSEIQQLGASPDQLTQLRDRCLTDAGASLQTIGQEKFDEQAKCILAATSVAGLEACGKF